MKDWNTVMSYFSKFGDHEKQVLRKTAALSLVNNGFEEVGSSDVNHEIVNLFGDAWDVSNGSPKLDWGRCMEIKIEYDAEHKHWP